MNSKHTIAICITVVVLFLMLFAWNLTKIHMFTSAGYTRSTLPGTSGVYWLPSDKEK